MQGTETTDIHPGHLIEDHEQVTLRAHHLAVDEPKGGPAQRASRGRLARTDLHVSPYPDLHVGSYADSWNMLVVLT